MEEENHMMICMPNSPNFVNITTTKSKPTTFPLKMDIISLPTDFQLKEEVSIAEKLCMHNMVSQTQLTTLSPIIDLEMKMEETQEL